MSTISTILKECNFESTINYSYGERLINGVLQKKIKHITGESFIFHNRPYFYSISLEYSYDKLMGIIVLDSIQSNTLYYVNYFRNEIKMFDNKLVSPFVDIDSKDFLFNYSLVLSSYKAYDFENLPKSFSNDYINIRLLPEPTSSGLLALKDDIDLIKIKYGNL